MADLLQTPSPAGLRESAAGEGPTVIPTTSNARIAVLGTSALLVLWEVSTRTGLLPDTISPLSEVLAWTAQSFRTPEYWDALSLTLVHWGIGLVIGAAMGAVGGAVLGSIPLLRTLVNSTLEFLRPIPAIVYLPLLLLVWGATHRVAVALAAVGALWPMLYQTYYGIRSVDPAVLDMGKVYGLTGPQRTFLLKVPMMLPFVATGIRISASLALIVAISIELVAGIPGIGRELQAYAGSGTYVGMYGYILSAGVLGTILNLALEAVERRVLRWHHSHRGGELA